MRSILLPLACLAGACLDPLVSDEVSRPELILPPGSEVPLLDEEELDEIDEYDGVDGDLVPLRSAFAGGRRIWYWDFGEASPAPIPLYLLVEDSEQGPFEAHGEKYAPVVGHPAIIGNVPGDYAYSPWWRVVMVPVTDAYQGEVLASFEAVDEALRQGLVEEPVPVPFVINCPVVTPETRLETVPGGDATTLQAPIATYYEGHTVHYFTFAAFPFDGLRVPVAPLYSLRREGGEPLSEAERGVDMTADGDLLDSNDLFAKVPGDEGYSDMVELVDAVVVDGKYIDRSGDDADSDLMDAAALFDGDAPDPKTVLALRPQGRVLNRPIQPPPAEETP